jgi:hypothetical protein
MHQFAEELAARFGAFTFRRAQHFLGTRAQVTASRKTSAAMFTGTAINAPAGER